MSKVQQLVKTIIITTVALFPSTVFAQVKPDSRGDYYSYAGGWFVVDSSSLNCRSGPGTDFSVLTSYPRGSSLNTFSELTGNTISQDRRGRPWVRIKWQGTSGSPCYVRANTSFIRPRDGFTLEQTVCIERELRRGLSFNNAAFGCGD